MFVVTPTTRRRKSLHRQLISRHFYQIKNRSDDQHDQMRDVFAITFRPGNRTGCFSQSLRLLGEGVLICLRYGRNSKTGQANMPVSGYRARMGLDGILTFGGETGRLFCHDAARGFAVRSRGGAIDPLRNPSLAELALRMDRACQRALDRIERLPTLPQLPNVFLGFAPSESPAFEDSEALRKLAAAELCISVDQLDGKLLVDQYLRDMWNRHLLQPGDPVNPTGSVLARAELCTKIGKALRVYEDYSELLGIPTWNPARNLGPFESPNPAGEIMREFGIDDLEQPISDEQLADLVSAVRRAIGPEVYLTEMEVFDAIANSRLPIRAWSPVLPRLRALLHPALSECTSDEDLLTAAATPDEPLICSSAARVQVLRRQTPLDADAFCFPPEKLGRNAKVDLTSQGSFGHCAKRP